MTVQDPYQLRVCDLRTDSTLDILPINGPVYDDYIGKTGSLSGTIPIPNRALATRAREALLPGRTMLHLERAGQLMWSGPLWTRTPAMDARGFLGLAVQAGTLEGLIRGHRIFWVGANAVGVDQFTIVQALFDFMEASPGGGLLIEVDHAQTSGVLRDRSYAAYDLPTVGTLVDQLGAASDGFEWRIQVYADSSGVRHRALRLGHPILSLGSSEMVLSVPGTVSAYSLPEDATTMATTWRSRGASINTNQAQQSYPLLSALLSSPDLIAAGWPLLEGSSDYPTVEDPDTLTEHATADLARARQPVVIPSVSYTVTGGADLPQLGSYVRLRIADDWHPAPGLSASYRVVGLRVAPAERRRPETCELYLEAA